MVKQMSIYSPSVSQLLTPHAGSLKDPRGNIAIGDGGEVYRIVTSAGLEDFKTVEDTGLYAHLIEAGKLIAHEACAPQNDISNSQTTRLLSHPRIPVISYPYEWCFEQLKRAALLQLDLYLESLRFDTTLSDATAFNVQFIGARPIFIDTLSFIPYREGMLWAGQAQFTQEYLNPLLIQAYRDLSFSTVYRGSMSGVPSKWVRAITPVRHKLSLRYFTYLFLPDVTASRAIKAGPPGQQAVRGKLPKAAFRYMLEQLRRWISGLHTKDRVSAWSDYTETRSYEDASLSEKRQCVADWITHAKPSMVLDFGCNTGEFSLLALASGAQYVVGLESDHKALSVAYDAAHQKTAQFLPLYQDLLNPSPSQGWASQERQSLSERVAPDFVLALAIIHHLAISGNIPLPRIVSYLTGLSKRGIIEWVPKSDPMIQALLHNREDIFATYTEQVLENSLRQNGVSIQAKKTLQNGRILYFYAPA